MPASVTKPGNGGGDRMAFYSSESSKALDLTGTATYGLEPSDGVTIGGTA